MTAPVKAGGASSAAQGRAPQGKDALVLALDCAALGSCEKAASGSGEAPSALPAGSHPVTSTPTPTTLPAGMLHTSASPAASRVLRLYPAAAFSGTHRALLGKARSEMR